MKKTIPFLKRILCFLLVGCILSSSMFVSYSNTLKVYASGDYFEDAELTRVVISIGLIVWGLGGAIYTGTLSTQHAISALIGLWGGTDFIISHFHQNEDGTYTIDEAFVQKVVSSMEDVANSTFNDDNVTAMGNGSYTYTLSSYTAMKTFHGDIQLNVNKGSFTRTSSPTRFAGYLNDSYGVTFYAKVPISYERYLNGVLQGTGTADIPGVNTKAAVGHSDITDAGYYVNFPVFSDYDAYSNYMSTGTGYKGALNYSEVPPIMISTLPGFWSGGNVTVSQRALDGVIDKVEELNGTDKGTDEKVQELVDFINGLDDDGGDTGGGDTGGGDTGGGGDGTVEGDSWHEKIFNVLVKIRDKMGYTGASITGAIGDNTEEIKKTSSLLGDILDAVKALTPEALTGGISPLLEHIDASATESLEELKKNNTLLENLQAWLEASREESATWHKETGEKLNSWLDANVERLAALLTDICDALGLNIDEIKKANTWLTNIHAQLKNISRSISSLKWTVADAFADAVNAFEDGATTVKDMTTELATTAVKTIKAPGEVFKEKLASVEKLGDALKVKFPFCIPWDVAFLLSLFRASPKTPHYEIPFKYGGEASLIQIDEVIVIDLEQFEVISKVCRTFLTIIFCKGLLDLTMKIVNMKEQEYDRS